MPKTTPTRMSNAIKALAKPRRELAKYMEAIYPLMGNQDEMVRDNAAVTLFKPSVDSW
jgi:hypothetical protein